MLASKKKTKVVFTCTLPPQSFFPEDYSSVCVICRGSNVAVKISLFFSTTRSWSLEKDNDEVCPVFSVKDVLHGRSHH